MESSPTPKLSAMSSNSSSAGLNRNQKVALIGGVCVLGLVLVVSALIFGGKKSTSQGQPTNQDKITQREPNNVTTLGGGQLPPEFGRDPTPGPADPGHEPAGPVIPTDRGVAITPVPGPGHGVIPTPGPTPGPGPGRATPTGNYVVQDGETLTSIARRVYGSANAWKTIAAANPGINPDRIRSGMKITLPDHAGTSVARTPGTPVTPGAGRAPIVRTAARTVVVHEGDTLYSIARRSYGDGEKWDLIYNANKSKISDPDKVPAGVTLTIPQI
jgi:nucleoid-associated protein YgaU